MTLTIAIGNLQIRMETWFHMLDLCVLKYNNSLNKFNLNNNYVLSN